MAPTSDDPDSSSKKYSLRLQMPVDDADVEAFLAAQGARHQSQAIVMLIRMWVNEFGPTNVLEQAMGSITMAGLKRGQGSAESAESAPGPANSKAGNAGNASRLAPDEQPEQAGPSTPSRPPATPQKTERTAAGPSDDFEDLFRRS